MSGPLIAFVIILVGLLAGSCYLLRDIVRSLLQTAAEHARCYALPYFKGTALVLIACLASFDETFRGLARDVADTLPWWEWARLFFKPVAAGLAVIVAFLDHSVQRSNEQRAQSKPPFPASSP